jgi:hypothetical protein
MSKRGSHQSTWLYGLQVPKTTIALADLVEK